MSKIFYTVPLIAMLIILICANVPAAETTAPAEAPAVVTIDSSCTEWLHVARLALTQWEMAKSTDGIRQARDIYESVPIAQTCKQSDYVQQADYSITYGLNAYLYALTTPAKVDNELALAHYHLKRAQATVAQIRTVLP
jgi:hypothetical protein